MKNHKRFNLFLSVLILLSLILPPVSSTSAEVEHFTEDTFPPAPVINLQAVAGINPGTIDLSWIAPGDDGTTGTATAYLVRYNIEPITEDNWASSTNVAGEPLPQSAGSVESMTITGLPPGLLIYVALKTQDEVPNTSAVSNVVGIITTRLPKPIFLPLIVNSHTEVPVVIPDTTKVLSESTTQYLAGISNDGSTYTFSQSTPEILAIDPGDIMVSDVAENAPHGFLRQVTSISMVGDQVIIVSDQAALDQAIESGEVKLKQTITPNEVLESSLAPGVQTNTNADKFEFYVHDLVLYDGDGNPFTKEDQITADGTLGFELGYDFTLLVQDFELKECSFTNSVTASDSLEIKTKVGLPVDLEHEFARIYLNPITVMVGYLPVVIEPVITINIGLKGEVSVGVETSVTQVVTLKTGIQYKNGEWGPISEFSNEFQIDPPHLTAGLDFKAYFGPRLSLLIYGLVGPYADVDIFAELEADIFDDPWWSLYGGLEVPIGVRVEVLSHRIAHYETVAIGFRILLAQAESNNPPNAPSNPIPINGAQNQSLNIDLFWSCGDSDGDIVTFSVYLEANDPTPDFRVSEGYSETSYHPGTLLANTQYYWQIVATDEHGATNAGLIWNFKTGNSTNHPPNIPSNPNPLNDSIDQGINIDLSWSGGDPDGDLVTYDVYLEEYDLTPDILVCGNVTNTICDPGTLLTNTVYYWKVLAFDEHGVEAASPLWRFTTGNGGPGNNPPYIPSNPSPADGSIDQDININLSWSGGDPDGDAVTYDVYFEANDDTPDVLVSANQPGTTYDPGTLAYSTHYYWQIVAEDEHGATSTGPVWDFVTLSQTNNPPYVPSSPSPADGAIDQSVDVNLSWSGGDPDGDSVTYDVYFEANDSTPDVLVSANQPGTSYDPGTLAYSTHYYWQIVAEDEHGSTTTGPVWDFITVSQTNNPPYEPSNPEPPDGVILWSVEADLSWSGGDPDGDSVTYDVYFEANDSTPDVLVSANQPGTSYDPGTLEYYTIYFWQIVAEDEHGATSIGPVWDFWTEIPNSPPYVPYAPSPADGATNQSVEVDLNWIGGDPDGDSVTYDVYFEAGDDTPDILVSADQIDTTYDPGTLATNTHYYWQIVAKDEHGATSTGPVWDFVTLSIAGTTVRVSVSSSGEQGNDHSWNNSISADGRYVTFVSYASNLVAGDTNGVPDIFVHDRQTGVTERVSISSSGEQGNFGSSHYSAISADGRYVAFESDASNLVDGDTNGVPDIFVHDRQSGVTERVSVSSSGEQGNGLSIETYISADGRYVAYSSYASNLVDGDTNGAQDIFMHDRQTGVTERISVSSSGEQGNSHSYWPSISADGRYVAFESGASNLVDGDTNGAYDIFMHDRQTGVTERVSVNSSGEQGNSHSFWPSISADGRYVAFESDASNLVAGDTNGARDIFLHDRQTGVTERISVNSSGEQGNGFSAWKYISADGRYVAFESDASNLVDGDTNGVSDIFVHGRQTGVTERVSVSSSGEQGNYGSHFPAISADGRYIAFDSDASNLVDGDTNWFKDVFVYDRGGSVKGFDFRKLQR
jgi:hypothetical protein